MQKSKMEKKKIINFNDLKHNYLLHFWNLFDANVLSLKYDVNISISIFLKRII